MSLPLTDEARIRILQVTDTHLFTGKHEALLGINTWRSCQTVLSAIHTSQRPCDLIVATDNLTQDRSSAVYQYFAKDIASFAAPCVWLPGNHDFQPVMYNTLQTSGISPVKRVFLGDHWQVLLLDSRVFGVPHDGLSDFQLEQFEHKLAEASERCILLLLHRHPLPVGCSWLDQRSLRDADTLDRALSAWPRVRHLLYGHIHQELDPDWNGRRMVTTPSACVQFRPHYANFTLDTVPPGWRWLKLHPDGTLTTEVCRLEGVEFHPNIASEGY